MLRYLHAMKNSAIYSEISPVFKAQNKLILSYAIRF